jgi:23S rRNA C2498 (ribose-2'-O)-methylase RlmM
MTEHHRVRTSVDMTGWRGSCSCGWSVTRRTRQLRDTDVDAHQMANALTITEKVNECES